MFKGRERDYLKEFKESNSAISLKKKQLTSILLDLENRGLSPVGGVVPMPGQEGILDSEIRNIVTHNPRGRTPEAQGQKFENYIIGPYVVRNQVENSLEYHPRGRMVYAPPANEAL